jgi:uncharacterized protein (DUF58 family)
LRPERALIAALVACALYGALVAFGLVPLWSYLLLCVLVALVAAADALLLSNLPTPKVVRQLSAVMPVGVEQQVVLRLQPAGAQAIRMEVHDGHPGAWDVRDQPRELQLQPGAETSLSYRVRPALRGTFAFAGCDLRLHSPWRMWRGLRRVPTRNEVRVYPNFAPLARLAWVGAERASHVVGAHLQRRRGEGTEFQQLREYRIGDALRQIDWKASQRARRWISRDYQDERNQNVMLLLDTGRRMLARDGALTHFDHVLDAALLLAYIALRRGDAVGMLTTSDELRFLAPHRGLATIDAMLNTVFDLAAQPVATDYLEAAKQLQARQPRRSLVLILTNVRDEDVGDLLLAVRLLKRRHIVCVASLREDVLDQALKTEVAALEQALKVTATLAYLEQRRQTHAVLRSEGVDVLDVTCGELPAALVQHYLAMKRAARL